MPKISGKVNAIDNLVENCIAELLFCENSDEEDSVIEECLENVTIVSCYRYSVPFVPGSVCKSQDRWLQVLPNLDDDRFKQMLRVNRTQFHIILNAIRNDPLFIGKHSSKQMPLELQLSIVLYRLGISGEAATLGKIAKLFDCGDGGSILNATKRVFSAILKHKNKYITWPSENKRNAIVDETFDELPQCIGYIHGSEIPLAEKPIYDPDSFYSRKQIFSMKAQIVCDNNLKIMHLVAGCPGSVPDSSLFRNSSVFTRSDQLFSGMQWIAGDLSYPLSTTLITPFKETPTNPLTHQQKDFNKILSKYRIRVEHCFGVLKERFNSLKQLKIKITNGDSMEYANNWIHVCCILHNMLLNSHGNDEFIEEVTDGWENDLEQEQIDESFEDIEAYSKDGEQKRNTIMETISNNLDTSI